MSDFKTKIGNIRIKDGAAQSFMAMDSIANVLTGLGGGLDPQSNAFYYVRQLDQAQIKASFRSSWISKRVHSVPPKDMVRNWRQFRADNADITKIEKEERRLGLRAKVRMAELLSRLYGGSCLVLGTGDDTTKELRPDSIRAGGLKYVNVVGRHELSAAELIMDPGSPWYMQPKEYLVNARSGTQIGVHPSRMIQFIPSDTPDDLRLELGGWGDPLLTSLQSAIINADTIQGTFAAIAAKGKVDTVSIPGLTQMASTTQGEEQLKRRIMIAQAFESMFHTKLIDSGKNGDGESWDTFEPNYAGQPDLIMAFLQMVSGASQIPMTRLTGKSADGMNATGEGDERQYFDFISGEQNLELRPRMEQLDEILLRSSLGARPEDIWFDWVPLHTESDDTKAKTEKTRAETTKIYVDCGVIPDEVIQASVKTQLIESGTYPSIEQDYMDYEAGTLEAIIEPDEDAPDDPLIPLDENGNPRQARESRLFAANDMVGTLLGQGYGALEAVKLADATPRPLYVNRKVINVAEIQAWAKEQGLPALNDDLHVTIAFSREPVDWIKMGSTWSDAGNDAGGRLTINAGGPRVVEPLGDQAAVLMFASSDLSWRHCEMVREGASWDYADYTPHISLVKEGVVPEGITPYRGKIELDMEVFEEIR